MLRFPYHTRYELIEFAALTPHGSRLVPLHGPWSPAAESCCWSQRRRQVDGICTAWIEGLGILFEDSAFAPDTLPPSSCNSCTCRLPLIAQGRTMAKIRKSPVISGAAGRKYEIDPRRADTAERPLKIGAIVFLSAQSAAGRPLLAGCPGRGIATVGPRAAYAASQPYGPGTRAVKRVPFFEPPAIIPVNQPAPALME